jgi:hypothetical protein
LGDTPLIGYLLVVAFVEYKATSTEIQFLPGDVEIIKAECYEKEQKVFMRGKKCWANSENY